MANPRAIADTAPRSMATAWQIEVPWRTARFLPFVETTNPTPRYRRQCAKGRRIDLHRRWPEQRGGPNEGVLVKSNILLQSINIQREVNYNDGGRDTPGHGR